VWVLVEKGFGLWEIFFADGIKGGTFFYVDYVNDAGYVLVGIGGFLVVFDNLEFFGWGVVGGWGVSDRCLDGKCFRGW
jgi:hypothetical protein